MSGNRDYRHDPPSHQRLATRQAAASRKRSPEYPSIQHSSERSSRDYPLEDYPQTRRVFTSDNEHSRYDKEYGYAPRERTPPRYQKRNSPVPYRDEHDSRRQIVKLSHSSTNLSIPVKEERDWRREDCHKSRRSTQRSPPSNYHDRQPKPRYEEERGYKREESHYSERQYTSDRHSNVNEHFERSSENKRQYDRNISHESKYKQRIESHTTYDGHAHASNIADVDRNSRQEPIRNEHRKSYERRASPNYGKEPHRDSYRCEGTDTREQRSSRKSDHIESHRNLTDAIKTEDYQSGKSSSHGRSRERSKSSASISKKRHRRSNSRDKVHKRDSPSKSKRYRLEVKDEENRIKCKEESLEKENRNESRGEKSKIKPELELPTEIKTEYKHDKDIDEHTSNEVGSALAKARALLTKSSENYYSKEEQGGDDSRSCDGSREPVEVLPAEPKEEMSDSRSNSIDDTGLTLDFIKQSPHQVIDTKFLQHLSEMHPVSALHELTHRLGWPGPNITLAFDCGPPFAKMYIFKALVNGQVFQNTVAVNDVKIAKQNVAWLALQEMGFVKPDPANPV